MSIWPIKLSTWIDKDRKNCDYKRYVKMAQHWTCKNPKCSRKVGYGMWDMHSAPFGYGDGPFCSEKCFSRSYDREHKSKIAKKKSLLRRLALVCAVIRLGHQTESSRAHLLMTYGVTEAEVLEFQKKRPDNPKNHEKCSKRFNISFNRRYG